MTPLAPPCASFGDAPAPIWTPTKCWRSLWSVPWKSSARPPTSYPIWLMPLHPSIPWSEIIGMRHKLTHGYFDVDLDIVWSVVTEELPGLVAWLDSVLSPPPGA